MRQYYTLAIRAIFSCQVYYTILSGNTVFHKMPRKSKSNQFTKGSKIETFRLDLSLGEAARRKAREDDLSFSQLMRRAVKRELGLAAK
jgi:hypothetical protein